MLAKFDFSFLGAFNFPFDVWDCPSWKPFSAKVKCFPEGLNALIIGKPINFNSVKH